MAIDYSELAKLWAKTLAYVNCGKPEMANHWAQQLVDKLRAAGLYFESDGEGSRWRAIICTNPLGRQLHEGIGPTRATATLNAYSAWKRGVFEVVS